MNKLIDPQGRHIHKLRLALLDACNFRCVYCMPKNPKFLPNEKLIPRDEIFRISQILLGYGIDEIRITGGEPTLRTDFLDIVRDLSSLNLKKLGLTTNGLHFEKILPELSKTNLSNINFSLDSLNKAGFEAMTGSPHLKKVLESVFMAKELGFNVKLNVVLMKGINSREILDFVEFSGKYEIEVRFLELMRIGEARESFERHFISAEEVIKEIETLSQLKPVERPIDSTSFNYHLDNGAQIGFIASESRPFCGGCSRLRLSADGQIRPCLMKSEGFSLINKNEEEILELLHKTMALKPIDRIYDVSQPMNQIGG
ncbi:MAG: GTP 3',8-cyclase MoaA [Bacteriovoracaceae bacterium]|nr:GTP 3',8-cyclase MoaA [Bacteriovoracaceae bacterium]